MIRALTLLLSVALSSQVFAAPTATEAFIPVSNSLSLFVKHQPAAIGQQTIVILNGLTHTTKNWNTFLQNFSRNGLGIVQIDLAGQGETLAKHGAVVDVIRYQQQSIYVGRVLEHLKIRSKVTMLALSYGGGIATYFASENPQKVSRVILLAPYTEPQPDQDKWIRDQIAVTRMTFPYNTATDDELYDYFLRQLVYSTFPIAEPELLRIPYKLESVYRLAQGIRKLKTSKLAVKLPAQSVFLVGSNTDKVVKPEVLNRFWAAVPKAAKASRLIIKSSDHDLIALQPKLLANWVQRILANDPQTLGGKVTEVCGL